jgi:signal transduction histidine kinase
MKHIGARPKWHAQIMALPAGFAAILLGTALFALDSFTVTDGAASVLYVAVLVLPAGLWQRRGLWAATLFCIGLTVATYLVAHGVQPIGDAVFRRAISIAAILAAALLVLRSLSASETLDEQARHLDLTDDAIFVRNPDDIITYWNRGAERLYEWPRAEAIGRPAHALLKTQFPTPLATIEAALAASGRWDGELINTSRSGARLVIASRWATQLDERGARIAILESGTDVTRQRDADRALRRSEMRYRAIFHTAGVAIWDEDYSRILSMLDQIKAAGVTDVAHYLATHPEFVRHCASLVRLTDVDDIAMRMFETERREDLLESLDRFYLPGTSGSFARVLAALAAGAPSCESETLVRTLRGRHLHVLMSITFPPTREGMNSVLVSIMDITERRLAEESLILAQQNLAHVTQVSTLGALTAAIAHEVNQPLAAIVANAEASLRWLHRDVPDVVEAGDAVERIIRDGLRATEVVGRIRGFLGKTPPLRAPFALQDVLEEAMLLARREALQHGVSLHLDIDCALPSLVGDRLQIEQVVLNLLMNAIQSMTETPADVRQLSLQAARHGDRQVIVRVRDNGSGIAPAEMAKLFRPFFTTKPDGMGLGLSICRSIIAAHGGHIWASSELGQGAMVAFILPTEPVRAMAHA